MMAVMLAALMSDLDSIFNSTSTIFTLDIYKMVRHQASPKELMVVGRLFVIFIVATSIAWVPFIIEMQGGQMFLYIQEVSDYLTPPIAALFLLGMLWKRCNETGAFWGGIVGFLLGSVRLILAFVYKKPDCNMTDDRPAFIKDVHFMYVAVVLFWSSGLVAVVVSLCTHPPSSEHIATTTLWGLRNRKETTDVPTSNGKLQQQLPMEKEYTLDGVETRLISQRVDTGPEILSNVHLESQLTHKLQSRCMSGERGQCIQCLKWFCGFNTINPEKADPRFGEEDKFVPEMLQEPPKLKVVLNLGLLFVCALGIFLFVYFSL